MGNDRRSKQKDAFGGIARTANTLKKADERIYGAIASAQEGYDSIEPVSVFDIRPDPAQPRRVVPSKVLEQAVPSDGQNVLNAWFMLCEADTDWITDLVQGEDITLPENPGPILAALITVAQLAASIHDKGLTNPISVIELGDEDYMIETGERRWWAYNLLYMLLDDKKRWGKIPAKIVSQFDRFRQAIENTQRGDLNMIAKTRQWALLLMAQHEGTQNFVSYANSPSDRDFYAQAIGLGALDGAAIRTACGVTSNAALSHYRDVLELSPEKWLQADDESWGLRQIKAELNTFNSPSVKREKTARPALANPVNKRAFGRLWTAVETGKKIRPDDIDQIRRWLDEVERSAKKDKS
jgi:ParB-like chromosome segregation protein Spo0J